MRMLMRNKIDDYWAGFNNPMITALVLRYDYFELQSNKVNISDDTFEQLNVFFNWVYEQGNNLNFEEIISVLKELPTSILTYFMQMLHKKNLPLFDQLYEAIKHPTNQHQSFLERCKEFEKKQILATVLASERCNILNDILGDNNE